MPNETGGLGTNFQISHKVLDEIFETFQRSVKKQPTQGFFSDKVRGFISSDK